MQVGYTPKGNVLIGGCKVSGEKMSFTLLKSRYLGNFNMITLQRRRNLSPSLEFLSRTEDDTIRRKEENHKLCSWQFSLANKKGNIRDIFQ